MRNTVLAFLPLLFALACKSNSAENQQQDGAPTQEVQEEVKGPKALPTLPLSIMQKMVDSVDYVDYIWYNFDFSMSMDNPSGVQYSLAQIGEGPANRSTTCKPAGRIFYQIKGRNAAEAELFFSNGCTYMEFIENGKVVYANAMSPVGVDFLNNQFGAIIKDYQRVE